MNTQIKKLMVQAWVDAEGPDQGVVSEDGLTIRGILQQDMEAIFEQFAELVVQECMWKIMQRKEEAIDNDWRVDEAMSAALTGISEHFGVEL